MSNLLSERIQQRILEVAEGLNNYAPWEQNIAQHYQVLPLFGDLGGCLALRPDLEIVAIPDDPEKPAHVERNPLMRNLALYQGSQKFPEVAVLIPPRPEDAADCPDCGGTGRHPTRCTKATKALFASVAVSDGCPRG